MRIISMQSGSNGNCVYVETRSARLIVDAGISGKRAAERLAAHGRDIRDADGLLISHDHIDHTRCAGVLQRKFGLPIHVTAPTFDAARRRQRLGKLHDVRHFAAGEVLAFGDLRVETIPTPHDGVDGVGFVFDDGRRRLGVLTDLGHCFDGISRLMSSLDAVLIESNYDPWMLETGPYPYHLQQRIAGPGGHLSNFEAGELIAAHGRRLAWACLGHLSGDNNTPDLAMATVADIVAGRTPLQLAGRDGVSAVMEVG